jgi:uncharacterized membrane protein YdjX (TVP38/TMEM64 family)
MKPNKRVTSRIANRPSDGPLLPLAQQNGPMDSQRPEQLTLKSSLVSLSIFVALSAIALGMIDSVGIIWFRESDFLRSPLGPLTYILIKTLGYVIAPFSLGPIQVAAGAIFGLWPATLYAWIGNMLGGFFSFWLSRRFGTTVVRRFAGEKALRRIDGLYSSMGGWQALLFARVFLANIYDFVGYGAGLTTMRMRTYLLISAIGGVIPVFLRAAIGAGYVNNRSVVYIAYLGVGLLFLGPILHRWKQGPSSRPRCQKIDK